MSGGEARKLTATEAVLACAVARNRTEMHHARMALIESGDAMVRDIDRTGVITVRGTGGAGRDLLAGTDMAWADSTAARAGRLQNRLWAELADLGEPP